MTIVSLITRDDKVEASDLCSMHSKQMHYLLFYVANRCMNAARIVMNYLLSQQILGLVSGHNI
jgi:hypothetical protein